MAEEESVYKVEYLDVPEDSTDEKEFTWVARGCPALQSDQSATLGRQRRCWHSQGDIR